MKRALLAFAFAALAASALALDRSTTLIIQNQSNTTLRIAEAVSTSGKFDGQVVFQSIGSMQQVTVKAENDTPFVGCSGTIFLQPEHASGEIAIQFDNPYIGSNSYKFSAPAGWDCFGVMGNNSENGSGNDAVLAVRVEGKVAVSNRGPDINLATTGQGVVQGRVLWPTSYGAPSMDMSIRSIALQRPPGLWGFFEVEVSQPTKFQPYAATNSLTAVYYNGTLGELIDPAKTGSIAFAPLDSPPPGFSGFAFTISRLPAGVPVSISVSPVPGATWQPPRPVTLVAVAGATLKPSFYCVAADSEADLTSKMQNIGGFDFTVNTEWVASGSALRSFARPSTGSSKSNVQFGTLDATSLAVVRAAAKTTPALPAVRR